jgi:hypothetical protein
MKKNIYLIVILIIVNDSSLFGQIFKPFPKGLGIEVGLGYNQLNWHVNPQPEFQLGSRDLQRNSFYLTPTFRLTYQIKPLMWLSIKPFIGYNVFGGGEKQQPNGYKDKFYFKSIETGFTISYNYNNIQFGTGIKYNRHLKVIQSSYGYYRWMEEPRTWSEQDVSDIWFKKYSFDFGIKISYSFYNIIISSEFWSSLTSLEKSDMNGLINVKKNRFIILVGYQL